MSTRADSPNLRGTSIGEEIGTSCKEWENALPTPVHHPVSGITLFSLRCSFTPDTVAVRDRPAHPVAVSGP